jgi:signal recognition particle receptor subunit beta
MVFFNYSTMQMVAKIVYYGPGLCGKTTNLNHIYEKTSPKSRGEMVSLATETDRTLFFDLLPLDVGLVGGFKTKFQLYTVPGQVFYNATRKLVLKGVDGIVFVADSQVPMFEANQDSMANMWENLEELGVDLSQLPIVLQYNKRDLPNVMPVEKLNAGLNPQGFPHVEASAIQGIGVFETLKEVSRTTLVKLKGKVLGDDLKKSKSGTVEFKVQGTKSIKKAIEDEALSQDSIYEQTVVEKSDPGLPSVDAFEPLPVPELVHFDDFAPHMSAGPTDDLGEISKIHFDTIDLDGLEEEIESVEALEPEMDHMVEEVDLTSELEEVEFDEKTGAHYEHLTSPVENVDDTAPAQTTARASVISDNRSFSTPARPPQMAPPPPPAQSQPPRIRPEQPAPEPPSDVKTGPAGKTNRDLPDLLAQPKKDAKVRTGSIKSDSVDDLLSNLVESKGNKPRREALQQSIRFQGELHKAQMNCVFLDRQGNVVHTQLLQLNPTPLGDGRFELRLHLEIDTEKP